MMKLLHNYINKKVDNLIGEELLRRKYKVELEIKEQEQVLRDALKLKTNELIELNKKLDIEISEAKRLREKSGEEQKLLWQKLDILRDNLNTEQVWTKLWECAFSKSVDVVWGIMKNETVSLVNKAREEEYERAEKHLKEIYENRYKDFISNCSKDINIPLLLKRGEEAKEEFLKYGRLKDEIRENYYKSRIDLIGEVGNGNS